MTSFFFILSVILMANVYCFFSGTYNMYWIISEIFGFQAYLMLNLKKEKEEEMKMYKEFFFTTQMISSLLMVYSIYMMENTNLSINMHNFFSFSIFLASFMKLSCLPTSFWMYLKPFKNWMMIYFIIMSLEKFTIIFMLLKLMNMKTIHFSWLVLMMMMLLLGMKKEKGMMFKMLDFSVMNSVLLMSIYSFTNPISTYTVLSYWLIFMITGILSILYYKKNNTSLFKDIFKKIPSLIRLMLYLGIISIFLMSVFNKMSVFF